MSFKSIFAACASLFAIGTALSEEIEFVNFITEPFNFTSIHLQGIDCDESGIYYGFGNGVTKTDWKGKVLADTASAYANAGHIGDVCLHNGKLYATSWIQPKGRGVSEREGLIQIFDAATLKAIPEENKKLPYPTDGIAFYDGKFWIGRPYRGPHPHEDMTIAVWNEDFTKELEQPVRMTDGTKILFSVQTLAAMGDLLWHGCYADKKWYSKQKRAPGSCTYLIDRDGKIVCASKVFAANGIAVVPKSLSGDRTLIVTAHGARGGKVNVSFWEYKNNKLSAVKPKKGK